MTLKRAAWVADGKPRNIGFSSYKEYKSAKKELRQCHRKCANKYLQGQIGGRSGQPPILAFDKCEEEKNSNSRPGFELIFNGRQCTASAEINDGWVNYFAELYTLTQAAHFDEAFSVTIRNEMENIKSDLESSSEVDNFPVISVEFRSNQLKIDKA